MSNPAREQRDSRNFDIPLTATKCDPSAQAGAGCLDYYTGSLSYIFTQLFSDKLSV